MCKWVALVGLTLTTVGTFGDYGLPTIVGFETTMLGFAVLAICPALLGLALRRRQLVTMPTAIAVGAAGPVGLAIFGSAVQHLPSGPGALLMLAALVTGIAAGRVVSTA